jgi:ferritin-like metal-binding protein YciE
MKSTSQDQKAGQMSHGIEPDMDNSTLHELFLDELKDIYWAEKHLVKNMPKMAKQATSDELKNAIEWHLKETEEHVMRLEQVFESVGKKPVPKICEAMAGLIDEAEEIISGTEVGSIVRDAAIISCMQKIEHYEIATYGTLRTLANVMGHKRAEDLLADTLAEEKGCDSSLTEIVESYIYEQAKVEHK